MKYLMIFIVLITFSACNEGVGVSNKVNSKVQYVKLNQEVEKCKTDFKAGTITEAAYAKKMEKYGDIYAESVDAIPPERRYRESIFCYKEASRYDKSNKEVKEKMQKQKKLFQVVN